MEYIPSHTTPFHSYFTNPNNGISFYTTPFRSIPPDSINPNKALGFGFGIRIVKLTLYSEIEDECSN
jgi:hypothetical protein